jgi:hypothetical protein
VAGQVRILGTGQLLELQRRLRAAGGPQLRRNFARRIRRAAEPLHADLQRTVRTLPIRGEGSSGRTRRRAGDDGRAHREAGLRESIARAIRISVRTTSSAGATVWIDGSRLPIDQRNLPNKLDDGHWRHPVFGNKSVWVNQYAQPWWGVTIRRHEGRMRAEVARTLDDVARSLRG